MKPFGQFSHRHRADALHPTLHESIEHRLIAACEHRLDLCSALRSHPSTGLSPFASRHQFNRAPLLDQARQVTRPVLDLLDRQPEQREQGIVQFIRIAHDGPGLPLDFFNRCRVQCPTSPAS